MTEKREWRLPCKACGHDQPHDRTDWVPGCVADVMYEGKEPGDPPYWLQCACDGTSGPQILRMNA